MTLPAFTHGVDPSWLGILNAHGETLRRIAEFLDEERTNGFTVAPTEPNILRVLRIPVSEVRVVIVGQDPYPTPGHAVGWAFATAPVIRPLPRSLANIYRELHDDLGIEPAPHGDLTRWVDQGVMLLNSTLTVREGAAGSHRHVPWREITSDVLAYLVARDKPLVTLLWGRDAAWAIRLLGDSTVMSSAHPSPLSARRGFFGSTPFSRVNRALIAQGATPIDWRV